VTSTAPDRAAHRAWLAGLTVLPSGGTAVDLGCGRGEDLSVLAERHREASRLVGMDASAAALAAAVAGTADTRITFEHAVLDGRLPFDDGAVDLVYSHNLLECLADPRGFAQEVARILSPAGQAVVAHWDWDTQVFDGHDKARVRRLVSAFADWQQGWMAHADGWMGRRLRGVFHPVAGLAGTIHARVLTNTAFEAPAFGYENAQALRALVRRGLATSEDCEEFLTEQAALHARGQYFYSITGYAYVGRRTAG
jgi:SAM-dependent methyltransferase